MWDLLLFYFWAANPSRCFSLCLYTLLFISFDCCPLFSSFVFISPFCVAHSLSLSLSSCLGCLALLIWLPFLRINSLLRRMFFLSYAYCTWFSFVCLICFCLSFVSWFSLLSPFLATMSLQATFTSASFCLVSVFVCFFSDRVCLFFLRPCLFPVCFRLAPSILSAWLDS